MRCRAVGGGRGVQQVLARCRPDRRSDGTLSAGGPNAAQLDTDGRIKLKDGKRQYSAVLSFESNEGGERWQRLVLGALAAGGITSTPETAA